MSATEYSSRHANANDYDDEQTESAGQHQATYRANLEHRNPALATEIDRMVDSPTQHRHPSWFRDTAGAAATTLYDSFPTNAELPSPHERRALAESVVENISRNVHHTVGFAQHMDVSPTHHMGVLDYDQAVNLAAIGLADNNREQFSEGLDHLRRLRRNVQRTLESDYPEFLHEEYQADDQTVTLHVERYREVLSNEHPSTQAAFLQYKQDPSQNHTRELTHPTHFHSMWNAFHEATRDLPEVQAEAVADLIAAELFAPKLDHAFSYTAPDYDPAANLNRAVYDADSFNDMYKASASDSIAAAFQAADQMAELIRFNDATHFVLLTGTLATVDANQRLLEQSVDHTPHWHTEDAKQEFETARAHRNALMYHSFGQEFQSNHPGVASHDDAVDTQYHDDITRFLNTHMDGDREAFLVHLCLENARHQDKSGDPELVQENWSKVAHLARPPR